MLRWVLETNHLLTIIAVLLSIHTSTFNITTGRNQLAILPESDLQYMASQEYREFLKSNEVLSPLNNDQALMVQRVGVRLSEAVSDYYQIQNLKNETKGYKWEFNLVDSPDANAWCLPGGKVIVYTGLLNITQSESELAVVMGHEIAHAIAKHGNERMSRALIANGIGIVGSIVTSVDRQMNTVFESVYWPCSEIHFLLPNSRRQELEADKIGLVFITLAGYDPGDAVALWEKMKMTSAGGPPEFLSTHPTEESRIKELQRFMPNTLNYFKSVDRRK